MRVVFIKVKSSDSEYIIFLIMWSGWCLLLLPAILALRDHEPAPPAPSAARDDDVIEGRVAVRLNHFDASNTDTFDMRFYHNTDLGWSGDIVIFVGGEWPITPGWARAGLAYELAQATGAGLFYTEHRYYGLSRPSADTSVPDLRYLTVDQALADLAQFIQYIRSDQFQFGRYRDGKVALVGCSYAGSMATWMRLAYPHLVQAAFSDSGPLHAQEDFPEYLETIAEAIRVQGSEECLATIEEAVEEVVDTLGTTNGPTLVSDLFNTCTTIQAGTPMDVATFFWFGITETFAYLVQYATPGDIAGACSQLTATNPAESPMRRLARWVGAQQWTQPCIETRYVQVVAEHTDTSYDAPTATMRLWTYQTCIEFGWYQTTTSERQPFLGTVPLEYFHQMCRDFFSAFFDENVLRAGVERTNLLFAGLSHLPDRVVSVAGGHDPWSPMGPNETHQTDKAPVYVVPEVSHCRAIYGRNTTDEAELEAVKQAVFDRMLFFMIDPPMAAATRPLATALAIAVAAALFIL